MKKMVLTFVLLITMLFTACIAAETSTSSGAGWMNIQLKDVRTGETFTIADFKGRPVLLESFAVWCPTCTEQQKRTKEFAEQAGDAIVHVSLDTDPNEDEEKIKEHIEANGFDWYYAVSPIELTNALIDEYGLKVVNAPSVPMILICPDQSTRFLPGGVKTADKLLVEVEKGC